MGKFGTVEMELDRGYVKRFGDNEKVEEVPLEPLKGLERHESSKKLSRRDGRREKRRLVGSEVFGEGAS